MSDVQVVGGPVGVAGRRRERRSPTELEASKFDADVDPKATKTPSVEGDGTTVIAYGTRGRDAAALLARYLDANADVPSSTRGCPVRGAAACPAPTSTAIRDEPVDAARASPSHRSADHHDGEARPRRPRPVPAASTTTDDGADADRARVHAGRRRGRQALLSARCADPAERRRSVPSSRSVPVDRASRAIDPERRRAISRGASCRADRSHRDGLRRADHRRVPGPPGPRRRLRRHRRGQGRSAQPR